MEDKGVKIGTFLTLATGVLSMAFLLASQPGTGMSDAELAEKAKKIESRCYALKNLGVDFYRQCIIINYTSPETSGTPAGLVTKPK